jgi:hypothetical protein
MPKRISPALVMALACFPAFSARASDGVIEISQACVATGCVPGDTPGFPVTIGQAGSYRLTSNLSFSTSEIAIDVTTNDVAIDLGGFVVASTNFCTAAAAQDTTCSVTNGAVGIHSSAQRTRVSNGRVVGAGGTGVQLGAQAEVEHVAVAYSGGYGIQIVSGHVASCSAFLDNDFGIYVPSGPGLVELSTASQNGNSGIIVTDGEIDHCQSSSNYGAGLVIQGSGSLAIGNLSYSNVGYGISGGALSGYAQNVVNGNNGGNANAQTASATNLGGNLCGGDTICP